MTTRDDYDHKGRVWPQGMIMPKRDICGHKGCLLSQKGCDHKSFDHNSYNNNVISIMH
ncbi:hypothetical protein Syun_009357 [Stephania yunnanensis]|uniref:Uncharacterized protein n=1 Tax=Stephania yunnanensis TaxID=152371 RepID=A0AAP0KED3_9MAGN